MFVTMVVAALIVDGLFTVARADPDRAAAQPRRHLRLGPARLQARPEPARRRDLRRAVLADRSPPGARPPPRPSTRVGSSAMPPVGRCPALVDRDDELRALSRLAGEGGAGIVVDHGRGRDGQVPARARVRRVAAGAVDRRPLPPDAHRRGAAAPPAGGRCWPCSTTRTCSTRPRSPRCPAAARRARRCSPSGSLPPRRQRGDARAGPRRPVSRPAASSAWAALPRRASTGWPRRWAATRPPTCMSAPEATRSGPRRSCAAACRCRGPCSRRSPTSWARFRRPRASWPRPWRSPRRPCPPPRPPGSWTGSTRRGPRCTAPASSPTPTSCGCATGWWPRRSQARMGPEERAPGTAGWRRRWRAPGRPTASPATGRPRASRARGGDRAGGRAPGCARGRDPAGLRLLRARAARPAHARAARGGRV